MSANKCTRCGHPLHPGVTEGICPRCLFDHATDPEQTETSSVAEPSGSGPWIPPKVETLAALFQELEVFEMLGRGGMGAVYKVRQKSLDRMAALKVLPRQVSLETVLARRFVRESQAMAKLNDPHIVTVYDSGQREGLFYFLMEFVDGMNLRQWMDAGKKDVPGVLQIVLRVCQGLQYAHERGIVHRDIKPENILLNLRGQAKIADFGIAKLLGELAQTSTTAEQVIGTPKYMAPEQLERPTEVDHRADIYSLGVLMYQMLTGGLPIGRFPPPSQSAGIDLRLDGIVLRMLEKEPGRRYQSAREVGIDLAAIAGSTGRGEALGSIQLPRPDRQSSRLMVFMFTDVADSTRLKQRENLGAAAYADLARKHDLLFRQIAASIPGADVLKDVGDGYMATFATASDAVRAALRFQFAINTDPDFTPASSSVPFRVRIGVHQGEVSVLDQDIYGKPKLVGPAADMTARIQSLALPGQILVSRAAFDNARQYVRDHPICGEGTACPLLCWEAHGFYRFTDISDPQEVFEVGAQGTAPSKAPEKTDKAWYVGSPDDEAMRGWRPALGQSIPRRAGWVLEKKIGDGGFGEVWLASHKSTKEWRVCKFCFSSDRLRSFKREMTLFRLIRDALGNRNDIARLYDISLESPPYLLESQYEPGGNLLDWAGKQGGIDKIPLSVRLDLVIRIAEAVAAAHSVGILHKDLKPSNILIRDEDGNPRPVLSDFGIGILTDRSRLNDLKITQAGFTQSLLTDNESSRSGTRMYAPPESTAGKTFTTAGDVYALGVILYQMAVGDLERPIGEGWQRDVPDELLREDIASAVDGDPARRIAGAAILAAKLRELDARRAQKSSVDAALRAAERAAEHRKRLATFRRYVSAAALVFMGVVGIAFVMVNSARQSAEKSASDSDYQLGSLLAGENKDTEALAYLARALRENPENRNAMVRSIAILYRHPVPLVEFRHNGSAMSASFSPDGKWVITANDDDTAQVWDAATGKPLGDPMRHAARVNSASFSPDDKCTITASDDGTVRVWDATTGKLLRELMRPGLMVKSAFFSPDSLRVVTASDNRMARVWDAASGKPLSAPMWHQGPVNSASFSPDGSRVVTASEDGTARIWDAATGKPMCDPMQHEGPVNSASFSPDGTRVVTASEDHMARVWDADTSKQICGPMHHEGPVKSASFSPDGSRVVTASEDGTARIWDAATSKQLGAPMRSEGPVNSASFSPDGTRVVTAILRGNARVWDSASSEPLCEPMRHDGPVNSALFSPDGSRVVTAGADDTAREWDAATGKPVCAPMQHEGGVISASFSPDGTRVVTASYDHTARLWDAANGQLLGHAMMHKQKVNSASFSPDGKRVVTASEDSTAQVWDSATRNRVGEPMRHGNFVRSASFSRDGRLIVTVCGDGTARIWDCTTGEPRGSPMLLGENVYTAS
ncbi:MAG: protein kinase, partial [Tepidisphaeraceae bacterium]